MPGCSGECPCNEFAVVMSQGCFWLWSFFFFLTMWLCVCIQRETWTTFNYNVLNNASVHVNWCFVSRILELLRETRFFSYYVSLMWRVILYPNQILILAWVMCFLCLSVYTVSSSLTSNILTTFFFGLKCSSLFILLVYYWWNFC